MQIQQLRYLTASKLLIITLLCSTINFCQLEKVSHDKQSTVKEDGPLDASTTSDNVSRTEDAKNPAEAKDGNKSTTISLSKKDIYKAGLRLKRAEQVAAVKLMMKIEDYAKQYKMVKLVLEKIFQMLSSSKLEITQSSYIPGQEFPKEEKELEALAHVIENTAFFGDILLRIPDITHSIYKSKKEWRLLVHWSVGFCNETGIFDGTSEELLSLVAQELRLVPRDPNYVNPYKAEFQLQELMKKKKEEMEKQEKKKANKAKSKKRKGPRLSRTDL